MKELTYEDWVKNPAPRVMWVWDFDEEKKVQRKVIYIIDKQITYRVIALIESELSTESFMHCAEIEEPKTRRMTNKELSRWLRENPTREWKYTVISTVHSSYSYDEECADVECWCEVVVREDDGEWKEPLIEVTDD